MLRYLAGWFTSAAVSVLAFPLFCYPALARAWAGRHRDRAYRLLGNDRTNEPEVSTSRALLWLPTHGVAGVVTGLLALVCAGNAVQAALTAGLWWAFPPTDRPRLVLDLYVDSWPVALTIGPLQAGALAALLYLGLPPLARAHARLCLVVLRPSRATQFAGRIVDLTRSRAEALDAHSAELRRIERDLHDGTQARLVDIAMRIDLARRMLPEPSATTAHQLLREAHEGTEDAMAELRGVLRTIYPPILADRGLSSALDMLTARCPATTRVRLGDLDDVPAAMQAVVYFAVAEALTNITRHSRATLVEVVVERVSDRLRTRVTDNGVGGADAAGGTGLAGIRGRVAALDGTFTVDSPVGGPTTITLDLPCG